MSIISAVDSLVLAILLSKESNEAEGYFKYLIQIRDSVYKNLSKLNYSESCCNEVNSIMTEFSNEFIIPNYPQWGQYQDLNKKLSRNFFVSLNECIYRYKKYRSEEDLSLIALYDYLLSLGFKGNHSEESIAIIRDRLSDLLEVPRQLSFSSNYKPYEPKKEQNLCNVLTSVFVLFMCCVVFFVAT